MSARNGVSSLLIAISLVVAIGKHLEASDAVRLLVPYVRQTKALCGGAAAAMVFRYWGDDQADMRQFAPLLDRAAGGLATDVLAKAIEDRGWRVIRFTGSIESVADLLRDGRPVIVLVKQWSGQYHYVVLVGITDTHVVVHDPARGPSRQVLVQKFSKSWEHAGFWALVVLPERLPDGQTD